MTRLKEIFKSKKFWTLVTAIVAALSAYFVAACSSTYRVTQSFVKYETSDSTKYIFNLGESGSIRKNKNR